MKASLGDSVHAAIHNLAEEAIESDRADEILKTVKSKRQLDDEVRAYLHKLADCKEEGLVLVILAHVPSEHVDNDGEFSSAEIVHGNIGRQGAMLTGALKSVTNDAVRHLIKDVLKDEE